MQHRFNMAEPELNSILQDMEALTDETERLHSDATAHANHCQQQLAGFYELMRASMDSLVQVSHQYPQALTETPSAPTGADEPQ